MQACAFTGPSTVTIRWRPKRLKLHSCRQRANRFIAPPALSASSTTSQYAQPRQSSDRRLILGLTKYSHDAAVAVVDADTGEVLFALAKERLTRRKHDGGGVAALVRHALRCVTCGGVNSEISGTAFDADAAAAQVSLVVANNHHHRIRQFDHALPFSIAAGYAPREYASPWNLLPAHGGGPALELSHHLAHAHSAICNSPSDTGIVVIMDGMGDLRDDWLRAESPSYHKSTSPPLQASSTADDASPIHHNDLLLSADEFLFREYFGDTDTPTPGVSFREAESAYRFAKRGSKVELTRLFKRWTPEASPPELYNHGFEHMESVGAVYSRCATQIFGDWNACGKVMGLAPWISVRENKNSDIPDALMGGNLYDGSFRVNSDAIESIRQLGHFDSSDSCTSKRRLVYEQLAARVQTDLEQVVLTFLSDLNQASGESSLVFAGGVALNSTLNGRIVRESGFDHVFIPAHPGDEGVALGCAMFGYAQQQRKLPSPPTFLPYLGTAFDITQLQSALSRHSSWVTFQEMESESSTINAVVNALCEGEVVGWCRGRSEFGPRALGNRSLLADPRRGDMVKTLNRIVKKRELFRPFAPSCIEEHVRAAFGDNCAVDASPYMSMTHPLLDPERTPAVAHVDGSARLQTLRQIDNPVYHGLIQAFQERTGTGMLLNTSFNVAGEPIVDSCEDAIRTLLNADGIGLLAFPDQNILVRRLESPPGSCDDDRVVLLAFSAITMQSNVVRNSIGDTMRASVEFDDDLETFDESEDCDGGDSDGEGASANIFDENSSSMSHLALDELYMEECTKRRTVWLDSEEHLELLELIAREDHSTGISIRELLRIVNEEEDGEEEINRLVKEDDAERVRQLIQQLWRQRLVQIDEQPF
jgi:carbamoyltransferase